jgi:hypothetical protein
MRFGKSCDRTDRETFSREAVESHYKGELAKKTIAPMSSSLSQSASFEIDRMARQAEKRSHLDLQVGMPAEQELTAMLQMQHKICQRLGIDVEPAKHELKGFSHATDVGKPGKRP